MGCNLYDVSIEGVAYFFYPASGNWILFVCLFAHEYVQKLHFIFYSKFLFFSYDVSPPPVTHLLPTSNTSPYVFHLAKKQKNKQAI